MKVLVAAKRVTDPDAKIRVKPDGSGIVEEDLDFKPNPFDENAVEAALELREEYDAEVVVVSIGPDDATQTLRTALAMGCDRGILVEGDDNELDGDLVARVLAALYKKEQPDIVLLGKQCIDGDSNQVGQLLAEYLGLPQACFASELKLTDGEKVARVSREVDGGIETVEVDLPAVITADLRLNEPRYASLPGIMKAKRKKIDEYDFDDLDIDPTLKVATQSYVAPAARQGGFMVNDVTDLVSKLKNEAKVL
ncbi:MAG: electron transfer flavoprotein beta subunit [Myxococcota bacterium]